MVLGYIEKLVSFGPHPNAKRISYKLSNRPIIGRFFDLPIEKVAKYLFKEFESMGLEVEYHHWEQEPTLENLRVPPWTEFGWFIGDNVVATLPGADKNSDEIYIVMAHYDTVKGAPGANDDSSGVAAVLCAAKLMSQYSFNHTIRFIATSGEEVALQGSRAYAQEVLEKNENIVAVLNVDMIGNQAPGIRNDEIMIGGVDCPRVGNFTIAVNQRYSEYLNFTIIQGVPGDCLSDHRPFINRGYDAIFFAEAVDDREWHLESDTIENMNVTYATKASKLVLATLAELAWDARSE
jgi:Zn-dependent M28 family amino/carboxypeptidase